MHEWYFERVVIFCPEYNNEVKISRVHVLFILNTTSATKFACLAVIFYFKIKWLGLNISSVLLPLYFGFFKKNNTLKPKLELYFSCTCGIFGRKKIILDFSYLSCLDLAVYFISQVVLLASDSDRMYLNKVIIIS